MPAVVTPEGPGVDDAPDRQVDVLGAPYLRQTLPLEPDDEGEVVATLVSRSDAPATGPAVLHLHGFCDYFFQTGAADFWTERGYAFYALDLRKYGRSLRPHQTPNFARDLDEYAEELTAAFRIITERDGHDRVLLSGHSTGGMIGSLWAARHEVPIEAVVLNSPWLDLQGSFLLRTAGTQAINQVGARRPYQSIPRHVSGLYGRSLHADFDGEWDYELAWKPIESWPVYAGWLRAVRRGHAAIHRGLGLTVPTLVVSSAASLQPQAWEPAVDESDTVLDVALMAKWVHKLSRHVTLVQVPGALHDVTLSRQPARDRVYDELDRWLGAYLSG